MKYSLTKHYNDDSVIAWNSQGNITHAQFLEDVIRLSKALPDKQYAVNLCEDRYHFIVAFASVLVKGQTNLLPQSRAETNLKSISNEYSDCYILTDVNINKIDIEQIQVQNFIDRSHSGNKQNKELQIPVIDPDLIAAIAFTSGSTGKPQANAKSWHALVTGAAMAANEFGLEKSSLVHIVATVPPQHMYGLETSILYTLQSGCPVYAGKPFYPEDIRRVLEAAPKPVILVTTPVHLRACINDENMKWEHIEYIISATAPLGWELAKEVEKRMNTRVMEIFGCTEVGSMAVRETLKNEVWALYSGITIYQSNGHTYIHAPHVGEDVILNDVVNIVNDKHFKLIGRDSDMVNIAGKRGSIADISLKLQQIEGVEDATVFLPDENNETGRLAAFVKTKVLSTKQITKILKDKLDSVFIPRPLYIVNDLPYNETGKLTRKDLLEVFNKYKGKVKQKSKDQGENG